MVRSKKKFLFDLFSYVLEAAIKHDKKVWFSVTYVFDKSKKKMIIKNEEKKERKKEKSVIGAKKSFFGECESVKRIEKKRY